MKNYLFIYGTLLSEAENQVSDFLRANSTLIGQGVVRGRLYMIDWYPGLVKSDDPGNRIKGQVVELSDNYKEVLAELDLYEGVSSPPKYEDEYIRKRINVDIGDESKKCWAYLFNRPIDMFQEIISGDFLVHKDS